MDILHSEREWWQAVWGIRKNMLEGCWYYSWRVQVPWGGDRSIWYKSPGPEGLQGAEGNHWRDRERAQEAKLLSHLILRGFLKLRRNSRVKKADDYIALLAVPGFCWQKTGLPSTSSRSSWEKQGFYSFQTSNKFK